MFCGIHLFLFASSTSASLGSKPRSLPEEFCSAKQKPPIRPMMPPVYMVGILARPPDAKPAYFRWTPCQPNECIHGSKRQFLPSASKCEKALFREARTCFESNGKSYQTCAKHPRPVGGVEVRDCRSIWDIVSPRLVFYAHVASFASLGRNFFHRWLDVSSHTRVSTLLSSASSSLPRATHRSFGRWVRCPPPDTSSRRR
mmetsp:Transcript_3797/g.23976  ORF Transcript_3797/g.23976 Transcript_3797/m.23976 type:complete len:200 (+) Transcript_3797:1148-1747(+)